MTTYAQKNYDGLAFARQSDKRISVKKKNGKKITADDIKQIKKDKICRKCGFV